MSDQKPVSSSVTHKFVELFNQLLEKDPEACAELLGARAAIHDEKTTFIVNTSRGKVTLGILGFLNTGLTEMGLPRVAVCHDGDSDQIVKFIVNEKCKLVDVNLDEARRMASAGAPLIDITKAKAA